MTAEQWIKLVLGLVVPIGAAWAAWLQWGRKKPDPAAPVEPAEQVAPVAPSKTVDWAERIWAENRAQDIENRELQRGLMECREDRARLLAENRALRKRLSAGEVPSD